jgi:hypothetical protein
VARRRASWLWALLLVVAAPAHGDAPVAVGKPFSISDDYPVGSTFMQIRLRGLMRLAPVTFDGIAVHELSGLAWDADEGLLYALSDDGFVVHLEPAVAGGTLTAVRLVGAYPLRHPDGRPVADELRDSEGLTARHTRNGVRGDAELLVSYEVHPRIVRYTATGTPLGELALPPPLDRRDAYTGSNNELEAMAELPDVGLVTAPERPLQAGDQSTIPIYALDGTVWHYPPVDVRYSALVGLEATPDGELLVLERRYASIFRPVIFSLRRMRLPAGGGPVADLADVVRFDTSRGWAIDNFESVAWHEDANYFMVSDDNDSLIQKTLLLYFEILPAAGDATAAR